LPGDPTGFPVLCVVRVALCPRPVEVVAEDVLGCCATGVTVVPGAELFDCVGLDPVGPAGAGVSSTMGRRAEAFETARAGSSACRTRVLASLEPDGWAEGRPGSDPKPPSTPSASAINHAASSPAAPATAARTIR
jgi:hypothetical protein